MNRRSLALIVIIVSCLVTIPALPAQAAVANGNVYVVVRDSTCGTPGTKVRDVQGNFNWGSGSSTINWEGDGDNIVYPRVRLGKKTSYQINAACFRKVGFFWQRVGYRAVAGSFTPTKNKQTIWVG